MLAKLATDRVPRRARLEMQPRYTRSDPRGRFPVLFGSPELEGNRLAAFWRPVIDITDSELASLRLRMLRPVAAWLASPEPGHRSWFSMIGVPELRHQVVRHAGLAHYACQEPGGLTLHLWTPAWRTLVEAIERFAELDDALRALVVFHLAQLSYCQFALKLAGPVVLDGNPTRDYYAYEVARVHVRTAGHARHGLAIFAALARSSRDPLVALASSFQGIGHAIRAKDLGLARTFEERGRLIGAGSELAEDWHAWLVRSRFHRALGMLRLAEARTEESRRELAAALQFHHHLSMGVAEDADALVVAENHLYLLTLQIDIAMRAPDDDVRALTEALIRLDPYCVEARLKAGDTYAAIGDYAEAARFYTLAGELGTGSGAVGWYRAAQCYDFLGERGNAVNAMGRCLELDETAIEPKGYLLAAAGTTRMPAVQADR